MDLTGVIISPCHEELTCLAESQDPSSMYAVVKSQDYPTMKILIETHTYTLSKISALRCKGSESRDLGYILVIRKIVYPYEEYHLSWLFPTYEEARRGFIEFANRVKDRAVIRQTLMQDLLLETNTRLLVKIEELVSLAKRGTDI